MSLRYPIVSPIGSISENEDASPVHIDLANVFKDPEGLPMVFRVVDNDNSALVSSSLFDRIEVFRITARGVGGSQNARVMLQSTFGKIF